MAVLVVIGRRNSGMLKPFACRKYCRYVVGKIIDHNDKLSDDTLGNGFKYTSTAFDKTTGGREYRSVCTGIARRHWVRRWSRKGEGVRVEDLEEDYGPVFAVVWRPLGLLGDCQEPQTDRTAKRCLSSTFIPTCRAPWENDWTGRQNAVRPRPWIFRTAISRKDDMHHDLRYILVGGYRGWQEVVEDSRERQGTTGTTRFRPS